MRAVVLALVCLTVVALASAARPDNTLAAFKDHVIRFNKRYDADELRERFAIFKENVDYINNYNAVSSGVELGLNQFADLTNAEFVARYTGFNQTLAQEAFADNSADDAVIGDVTCPKSSVLANATCDWRAKGAVTPVKNQRSCGSCWAFSATGSLEAAHFLKTGELLSLSEQNLVDCSFKQGNEGCEGGLMTSAFDYIKAAGGIQSEQDYPYKAVTGKCAFDQTKVVATVKGYKNIKKGDESDLIAVLTTQGPVSVAIDASRMSFQFYKKGVYYEKACSSYSLDHGVLAVGYGQDGDDAYYIVKNSWGATWGLDGTILMAKDKNNHCGIATMATYPLV